MADDNSEEAKAKQGGAGDETPTALTFGQRAATPTVTTDNALVNDLIAVMREEADVRKKELALKEKEIETGHEYSMKALDLQAKDVARARTETRLGKRELMIGIGFGLIVVVAFMIFCVYTNNAALAQKVVEIGGTAALSGITGYFYGKSKEKERSGSPPSPEQ